MCWSEKSRESRSRRVMMMMQCQDSSNGIHGRPCIRVVYRGAGTRVQAAGQRACSNLCCSVGKKCVYSVLRELPRWPPRHSCLTEADSAPLQNKGKSWTGYQWWTFYDNKIRCCGTRCYTGNHRFLEFMKRWVGFLRSEQLRFWFTCCR